MISSKTVAGTAFCKFDVFVCVLQFLIFFCAFFRFAFGGHILPRNIAIPRDLCSLVLLRCLESLPRDLNHGAETYVCMCVCVYVCMYVLILYT